MAYHVIVQPTPRKALLKLSRKVQRKVVKLLEALADQPRPDGVVKLAGDDNLWRVRIGDYRVVYEIHDARLIVLVLRIAHRKDAYR